MKYLASLIVVALVSVSCTSRSNADLVLANWTFQTSVPTTAGPHAAEVGTGSASGLHASGSTVYSNPTGNGSSESFSSNNWAIGDYYQFTVSTLGFAGLTFKFDASGSNTGPKNFKIQSSANGSSFTDIGYNYSLLAEDWSPTTYKSEYTFTVPLPASLDNKTSISLRLVDISTTSINGGTVGTSGSSRIDNVSFVAVPEPSAFLFGGLICSVLGGNYLRQRMAKSVKN